MDGILLAAGASRRMAPLTTPKPWLEVAGRTLVGHHIEALAAAGCTRIYLVVPPDAPPLPAAPDGVTLTPVVQEEPTGTGGAVACAAAAGAGDSLVVMADGIWPQATLDALAAVEAGLAVAHVDDCSPYGAVAVAAGHVVGVNEKAGEGPGPVNTGAYRLPKAIIDMAAALALSPRGELELTDLIPEARPAAVETAWMDVGRPWHLLDLLDAWAPTTTATADATIEANVHVDGPLVAEAGARIRSGTYIEGPAWIGAGADIGPNAYLRGPSSIGTGCRVGAGSEVKHSILHAGAKAPHRNYVGDSILGAGANLGAGTTIANLKLSGRNVRLPDSEGALHDTGRRKFGAVIGEGAQIGIHCSLDPGTFVGADAWVGAHRHLPAMTPAGARDVG